MTNLDDIRRVALDAAHNASEIMVRRREEHSFQIDFKGARDLVTSTDLEVERAITATIRASFADDLILSEEQPRPDNLDPNAPHWIIDPIDGTANFAHGLRHCCTSIAFADKGQLMVAVVSAPFLGETFSSIRHEGAFLNGKTISVSQQTVPEHALVATGFPYFGEAGYQEQMTRLQRIVTTCRDIRRNGSAALDLCAVACGRMDAYYEAVHIWDAAGGRLIAEEAGAAVLFYNATNPTLPPWENNLPDGLRANGILVANPTLAPALHSLL